MNRLQESEQRGRLRVKLARLGTEQMKGVREPDEQGNVL